MRVREFETLSPAGWLKGCRQVVRPKACRQLVFSLPCRQVVFPKACRQLGFGWHNDVKLVDNDLLVKTLFPSCFWAKLGGQVVFGVLSTESEPLLAGACCTYFALQDRSFFNSCSHVPLIEQPMQSTQLQAWLNKHYYRASLTFN
ncbi:hypothetical protein Y032_0755g2076 [Ancylostoma ceylanicum]|uniref:Uncharacterized protein n=1 Tax=Ancylostoma ceylanicum TaxID=53326 RepID=A0A016WFZ9_9BILA|nr:hypothetical protein Y032_0755g2076 [Ancylostoma ceylanicum]